MVSDTNGVDVTTFKTKLEYGQIYSHMYIDITYEMTILFVGHTGIKWSYNEQYSTYIYSNYISLYLVDFVSLLNWSPDLLLFGILIYLQPFDMHAIREDMITGDIQMDIQWQTKKK